MMKSFGTATLLATAILATTSAQAAMFSYMDEKPSGMHDAGELQSINTSFDDQTNAFTWSHTIAQNTSGQTSDGFWLVVNDGPDPKSNPGQFAILYGDSTANRVTAYEYNGENSQFSFSDPANMLGSWDLTTTQDGDNTEVSFAIDATEINADYSGACTDANNVCNSNGENWKRSDWQGLSFDEMMGYWFHPTTGTDIGYDADGNILTFNIDEQGIYDHANLVAAVTPSVPGTPPNPTNPSNPPTADVLEPSSLSLVLLGLGLAMTRRRKAA